MFKNDLDGIGRDKIILRENFVEIRHKSAQLDEEE
jgi:hypothetical protein